MATNIEVDTPADTTRNVWANVKAFFFYVYCVCVYGPQFLVVWYPLFVWRQFTWPIVIGIFTEPGKPLSGFWQWAANFAATGAPVPWS